MVVNRSSFVIDDDRVHLKSPLLTSVADESDASLRDCGSSWILVVGKLTLDIPNMSSSSTSAIFCRSF